MLASGSFTYLSTFVCDQSSQRFGIEATEGEAQTPVHAVSGEFQSFLSDIILHKKKKTDKHQKNK